MCIREHVCCVWPLLCLCVDVCALPSTCLRSLLACFLCCDYQNPIHPPDLDIPLPSSFSATRSSLTPVQGAVERPQNTLPLPSRPARVEGTVSDGGSVAGLSCSTLAASEGSDVRWLLRTPRGQRRAPGSFCPGLVARLRRLNL